MNVADLMLDLGTGDATVYDPEIAAACGRIDVSCAIGEAAIAVYESLVGVREYDEEFIQEAATAGIATNKEDSKNIVEKSVKKALEASIDAVHTSAGRISTNIAKVDNLLNGLAKYYGVSSNNVLEKIKGVCKAFATKTKKLELKNAIVDPKYAQQTAAAYIRYISTITSLAKINLSSLSDPVVKEVTGFKITANSGSSKSVIETIRNINTITGIPENQSTTTTLDANGLKNILIAVYAIKTVSTELKDLDNGTIATAKQTIVETVDNMPMARAEAFIDGAKDLKVIIQKFAGYIPKVFNDKIYAIIEAIK